jgi:hypothetical protein
LLAVELNVADAAAVAELGKGHGQTVAPCAAGAANAVGVILSLHGQTKVEHVGDGGHVNTSRSHIGRYQNLYLTLSQGHQTAVAQDLA